ncbi:anti-sigma factor [Salisediminibacterium beveridgei]|uniref:Anti-sigma-W factor RsiW n=1 Tax=Salisediminibacterium beveridgei TaxID=632773 RepID=A0A1D7QYL0_9BACI|nr:anti-sigma factor [Salisediminibacterium beveridgei]AOM84094.1 hypothetical protein BBEV_2757 [Salisediminibacterium beveridgei]
MTDRNCEQLIDYFNHQLSDEEAKTFEAHLRNCESCQEELKELQELTDELPLLSEPVEPPDGMKHRVLSNVFEEKNTPAEPATPITATEIGKPRKQRNRIYPFVSGGLAAALLLSLIGNGYLWNEQQELSQEREQLVSERNQIESDYFALLDEVETPDEDGGVSDILLASNLASTDEEEFQGQGTATIISENGNVDLVIQVTDMPEATGTEVFQAWIIEGETPYPTGSFNIDEEGNGAVSFRISDMDDIQIDQIAITLEPQPNNQEPEGQMVLASQ